MVGKRPEGDHPASATQRSRIMIALLRDGTGMTRNELAALTGIPLQSVCLRVGELLEVRAITRGPNRTDAVTHRMNETLHAPRGQLRLEAFA